MLKSRRILLLIGLAALTLTSCIKQASLEDQKISTNRYLIAGRWLATSQYVRVADDLKLVKDTTFNFANGTTAATNRWIVIFNRDSTAYITTLPYTKPGSSKLYTDTTSRFRYTVTSSNINFTYANGTPAESDLIVLLTGYTLETSNTYQATPAAGWGLDLTKTYNYTEDITYTKQ